MPSKSKAASKKAPAKKIAAKKPALKKAPAKKVAAKKPALKKAPAKKIAAKKPALKKAPAKKTAAKKPALKKVAAKKTVAKKIALKLAPAKKAPKPASASFVRQQHQKLLDLRDSLLDAMNGVAKDSLRSRAEGSEASAFGMHQADAGSDAYDRDFALNLLSQEQDALYEIQEALKRIETSTYGVCEMSGERIPHARMEAVPFARYTVQCQTQIENEKRYARAKRPVTSLFGLTEDTDSGGDDDTKD